MRLAPFTAPRPEFDEVSIFVNKAFRVRIKTGPKRENIFTKLRVFASAFVCALILNPAWAEEDSSKADRNVVVYGDRIESTVSDTSISITYDEDFRPDMGIQGPNKMINLPATTRTDWDIKIRGIGRNYKGLGGDLD